ncbi:His/Gly/Thr/Pro-type tRNA ligase C-terminal domain-containing protein [Nocardia fusca]|uniref:His/Gly/Thr/Pro-type tRNA ligase C-terminal domain-containing protein n=1 Tax=Nocardia fusca TaxID=941183 RepID=A0ABV3FJW4_9NOCA
MERAVAHLIEQHGGAFPAWLAPVQIVVLPVSGAEEAAATALRDRCRRAGLRIRVVGVEVGSLAARVRDARLVPYHFILGPAEVSRGDVAVRRRQLPARSSDLVVEDVRALIDARNPRLWTD